MGYLGLGGTLFRYIPAKVTTMQGGYQIRDQNGIYFITFAVVEWVNVFTWKDYANLVVESLQYCQKEKGLIIHPWFLISNHLHLIVSAAEGFALSAILRDFKSLLPLPF